MSLLTTIRHTFYEHFSQTPLIVRSPGRINLIGEHTDYNAGFVLPGAIDKAIYMAFAPREDDEIHAISLDYESSMIFSLSNLHLNDKPWSHYVMGVIEQFQQAGHALKGFNCVIGGDVPVGAGLSSSAALECATAFTLNEMFGLGISRLELVKMAQRAENKFVGVQCGIMDQFASVFGKAGHVIQLDCRSLDYAYFPLKMEGISIVLCDSMVKHSLASTAYNLRREQCQEGISFIQKEYPDVYTLRDVTPEMLANFTLKMPSLAFSRCRYVVEENARLLAGTRDLEKGDIAAFGKKMFKTHAGLRDLYEVSCPELDILAGIAERVPSVLGARMMGGGFGGCTINLVKEEALPDFINITQEEYRDQTGKTPTIYRVSLQNGTEVVA